MNTTKKYWLPIVVVIILAVAVVGLSRQQKTKISKETIKIGAVLPLTGAIALSGGEQCRAGAMVAIEDINNSGGINNQLLELKIEDSKSNNNDGATAFNSLLDAYNPVAMLSLGSALSKTLSPMAEQNKIPLLATITADPKLTGTNNFTFRYYPTAEQEIPAIVKIAKDKNIKKFAVLNLNDDFGQAMLNALKNSFDGVVISESFNISDTDFKTQLTKIKYENPDGLLVVGFANHTITAIKQAKELGINSTLFSSSLATILSVRKGLNEIGADVFVPAPIAYKSNSNSAIIALKGKFEKIKNPQTEFDHYVVSCYDAVKILEKVLKNNPMTKEGIENGLTNLKDFSGLSGNVIMKGREFNFPLYPAELKQGEVIFIEN